MKEKILVLVKTYPTFSKKHFEVVCTAGINEKGEWKRIYPIPFRNLNEIQKYKKYQWIEANIEKSSTDRRPESYKVINQEIEVITNKPIDTKNYWQKRKELIFANSTIYNSLDKIIHKANKQNTLSLCSFKPKEITQFSYEKTEREWDTKKLKELEKEKQQSYLFPEFKKNIELVKKIPYKFFYHFKDINNKESKLMIEDWEIGQLYWNCFHRNNNNEEKALEGVTKKYKEEFLNKCDITLFLGTTKQYHGWANNPFLIIGVFYPRKKERTILVVSYGHKEFKNPQNQRSS